MADTSDEWTYVGRRGRRTKSRPRAHPRASAAEQRLLGEHAEDPLSGLDAQTWAQEASAPLARVAETLRREAFATSLRNAAVASGPPCGRVVCLGLGHVWTCNGTRQLALLQSLRADAALVLPDAAVDAFDPLSDKHDNAVLRALGIHVISDAALAERAHAADIDEDDVDENCENSVENGDDGENHDQESRCNGEKESGNEEAKLGDEGGSTVGKMGGRGYGDDAKLDEALKYEDNIEEFDATTASRKGNCTHAKLRHIEEGSGDGPRVAESVSVSGSGLKKGLRTLYYMPHCPATLYNNVLRANWSREALSRMLLVGNRLSVYVSDGRELPEDCVCLRMLANKAKLLAPGLAKELVQNSLSEQAFSDTYPQMIDCEDLPDDFFDVIPPLAEFIA
mmetsp:Transcript_17402/g.34171  ORF Transcript_17402/g.34171 Transcript_17402/m.34171 type:complete len:395 (-) Transcript_17402:140-1324(-)